MSQNLHYSYFNPYKNKTEPKHTNKYITYLKFTKIIFYPFKYIQVVNIQVSNNNQCHNNTYKTYKY